MAVVVTEKVLRRMVGRAYRKLRLNPDDWPCGQIEDELYRHGQFEKLIGATLPAKRKLP